MENNVVKTAFDNLFPKIHVKRWWKKGTSCIRVRQQDGEDLFFTYLSATEWKLETAAIFELSKDGV